METHQQETPDQVVRDTATELAQAQPGAQLITRDLAQAYVLAGHAIFTLVSRRTGDRKTFKLIKKDERGQLDPRGQGGAWFARLLTGPDNGADYRYLGIVWRGCYGKWGAKLNRDRWGGSAFLALRWFLDTALTSDRAFQEVEVWHTGRCGRCGRLLTVPSSVASGLGPVCQGREG